MTARALSRKVLRLEAAVARARPCPACGGRPWRVKLLRELAGSALVDEPGLEAQAGEPEPCPRCTPPGTITRIVAACGGADGEAQL